MYKKSSSVATIIVQSLTAYFEKLPIFFKYIIMPVLLQIFGGIVFAAGFALAFSKVNIAVGVILAIVGIVILVKAIWKFLLKMGGLVLISKQIIENEPVKELNYYTKAFESRSGDYISFLLISGFLLPLVVVIVAMLPISFVASAGGTASMAAGMVFSIGVIWISFSFFSVMLQSFALNPNLTPWESIVKAMKLVSKNYISNWGVLILYSIMSMIVLTIVSVFAMIACVMMPLEIRSGISNLISMLASQLFIPYWALCFTWWYLRMEKEDRAKSVRAQY